MCVMGQHLSSRVDLLSLNKPSTRKDIKKGTSPRPHTAQQQCQGGISLFPHREKQQLCQGGRGRTFPRGHCGSSVTELFVPSEQEQGLQSTVRLTLLWYFLQEPQNLQPSPQQGLQLSGHNNPEIWGRAGKADHHQPEQQWWEAGAKHNRIT